MSLLGLFKTAAVFTRATSTRALTLIMKYPKSSRVAAAVLSIPFVDYGLISLSRWRLETPILKKIEEGTKPELLPTFITIVPHKTRVYSFPWPIVLVYCKTQHLHHSDI